MPYYTAARPRDHEPSDAALAVAGPYPTRDAARRALAIDRWTAEHAGMIPARYSWHVGRIPDDRPQPAPLMPAARLDGAMIGDALTARSMDAMHAPPYTCHAHRTHPERPDCTPSSPCAPLAEDRAAAELPPCAIRGHHTRPQHMTYCRPAIDAAWDARGPVR